MIKFLSVSTIFCLTLLASQKASAMGVKLTLVGKAELGSITSLGTCTVGSKTLTDTDLTTCRTITRPAGVSPFFEGYVNADLINQIDIKNRVGTCHYKRIYLPTGAVISSLDSPNVTLNTCTMIRTYMILSLKSEPLAQQALKRIDVTFD